MYSLHISGDRVVLRTTSFRAERGSVLHSGIYSRELAASLFSGAVVTVLLFVFALWQRPSTVHFVVAALVFAVLVPLSRFYIFKEPELNSIFDPGADMIKITLRAPLKRRSIIKQMSQLRAIRVQHQRYEVENPDGVEFVKKIALQHGQVMPEFGRPEEFYSLVLEFEDEGISVLTLKDPAEVNSVVEKLKRFLPIAGQDQCPKGQT